MGSEPILPREIWFGLPSLCLITLLGSFPQKRLGTLDEVPHPATPHSHPLPIDST